MESEYFLVYISKALSEGKCPDLQYTDDLSYKSFDKYVDEEIANGSIIKHDQFSFTGYGWAKKVNQNLELFNSRYRLIAVEGNDPRIDTKCKGQAVNFILTKDDKEISSLIFTWSFKPFALFPLAK